MWENVGEKKRPVSPALSVVGSIEGRSVQQTLPAGSGSWIQGTGLWDVQVCEGYIKYGLCAHPASLLENLFSLVTVLKFLFV